MVTFEMIDASLLAIITLTILYLNARNRPENSFLYHRIFVRLIQLNIILLTANLISCFVSGLPGRFSLLINKGLILGIHMAEPFVPILWVLYIKLQVFRDNYRIQKIRYPLILLFSVQTSALMVNLFTGWLYHITPDNLWQRGDFYWIHLAVYFILLFYAFVFVMLNRVRLGKSHYQALLFFTIPPLLGGVVQAVIDGILLSKGSMAPTLLLVYFYLQNYNSNTDYLTGVYNRRQLDNYIKMKIQKATIDKSFSVILVDLNDFKQINDSFGHDVGDEALQSAVKIIKSCLRWDDFIARYGGDEFYIVLDINDRSRLEARVAQIDRAVQRFNATNTRPYKLKLCMGYDVYQFEERLDSDEFLKHIDTLMYKNKEIMKNGN